MATLKTLLDSALKASSTNAYINPDTTAITCATFPASSSTPNTQVYTCPADGLIWVESPYANYVQVIGSSSGGEEMASLDDTALFHYSSIYVSKGDRILMRVRSPTSTATVYFYPCRGQA